MGISIFASGTLSAICFPQGYLNDLSGKVGTAIATLLGASANAYNYNLGTPSGAWTWVRCAASNYNRAFYVTDQTITTPIINTMVPELVYSYGGTKVYNDYPYRYFFKSGQTVSLKVQNISLHTKKIYLRSIYLFNDYLPPVYNFRYMDLTKMPASAFSSLVFATSYSNFNLATSKLAYNIYNYGSAIISTTIVLPIISSANYALAGNFVSLPLCDPTLPINYKYDISSNSCIAITTCDKTTLKTNYCSDESTPLQCLPLYFISI